MCASQLRQRIVPVAAGLGATVASEPCALDFGAVMAVGAARGVDADLLASTLPAAEAAIIAGLDDDDAEVEE